MAEFLHRGTLEGAKCESCPFANAEGKPSNPVRSEFPDDPLWLVVGEGPGWNEVKRDRCFIGASGQVVNQILAKIGRPREHLFVGNATACLPYQGAPVEVREKAAECCKPRLLAELAQFPGKPILTLGAVAARSIIPQATLDAIDPPDVPKTRKKSQKEKQKAARKDEKKRGQAIEKIANRRFAAMMKYRRDQLKREVIRRYGRRPDKTYLDRETAGDVKHLKQKAWAEAMLAYQAKEKERALTKQAKAKTKPKKRKQVKITDIVGTLFDVDVDGTGIRPVIPAIHPAALLRGGGATIGGSHTPDMAFVNIVYDAAKCDALAKGKDIRLKLDVQFELEDPDRAAQLLLGTLQAALDENQLTIDLETYVDDPDRHHALMSYVAKIRVIGLATKDRRVSLAWDILPSWCWSYLQLVLGRVVTTYHNALYDRTVLRAYGFILLSHRVDAEAPRFEDTLLAHHASFPGNSHRLQNVVAQFYGTQPWKAEFRNQEETLDKLAIYNGLDTGGTERIVAPLLGWVKKTKTERVYERDLRMSDIASRMHLVGIPIDRDVNSQLVRTFTRLAQESKRHVEDKASDPKVRDAIKHHLAIQLAQKKRKADAEEFEDRYHVRLADLKTPDWRWKINNSKHISALLQSMGIALLQKTDGGAISTKKSVLESLVEYEIVRDILSYRQNDKMLDFVWPIFDREVDGQIIQHGFADPFDRIHPIWSIHKISGRWAASEPFGISNAPREKTKKVPITTNLGPDAIIVEVLCKCEKPERDHGNADHVFEAGFVEYAVRPTTKRQVRAPKGRKIVGFDFCLAKGTLIDTPNGHRPIEALKAGDLVFSFNQETKRPDCSRVKHKLFTGWQKTMKVILDNGEEVRCTHNHRWLVRPWGSGPSAIEVEAKDLRPGMRLLPLRRSFSGPQRSYETLYSYSAYQYVKTHIVVAKAAHGECPTDHQVHHKNENSKDNRPENLEYKLIHDHLSEHSSATATRLWKDPAFRKKASKGISEAVKARGGHHGTNNPNFGKRTGTEGTCPNCDAPTYFGGKHPTRFCNRKCYHEFRRKNPSPRGTKYSDLNHKIVAIVYDDLVVPTYDIEVERDHNFALAAGVFVHNCQLEARILALISGDAFMCDVFNRNGDLHTECARDVFPGFDSKTAKERKMARTVCKTLEYATWYGASDDKVWKGLLQEGYQFKFKDVVGSLDILRRKMSGIVRWQRETIQRASQPPFELRDFVSGRRRVWPMGQVEASEALNIVPQSTGSAIMNEGLDKMDQRIVDRGYREAFPFAQIHDAAVFECWADDAEALAADVKDCFECEHTNEANGKTIRFTVDVSIGDAWNEV